MDIQYLYRKIKVKAKTFIAPIKRRLKSAKRIVRSYPLVIQLPITYKCNFDCVMCGMHHMINRDHFSPDEIGKILEDILFKEVRYVGINGGEPFLRKDLAECVDIIIQKLPKLESINIISNGYFTKEIVSILPRIKELCNEHGITNEIILSVDGIGDMQDMHRGHENAFRNINNTITEIISNPDHYASRISIICTITRYNIERINEVEVWSKKLGVEVNYNIASENVRIENDERVASFSVFSDEHSRMLTEEFFYKKYIELRNEKYFALYLFVKTGKRYDLCPCMFNEWITLTPDSQLGFCATHSKNLGSAAKCSAYSIVKENRHYLEEIKKKYCKTCSHYMYGLNSEGMKLMMEDNYKNQFLRE